MSGRNRLESPERADSFFVAMAQDWLLTDKKLLWCFPSREPLPNELLKS